MTGLRLPAEPAAVAEVCASLRPGEPRPSVRAITVVLAGDRAHRPEDPAQWPARAVARVWALINVGKCDEAASAAQRLQVDVEESGAALPAGAHLLVPVVCAEALLLDARPREALPHARTAMTRAQAAGSRRGAVHALGLLAAASAVEGRTAEADERCREAGLLLSGRDVRTAAGRVLTDLDVWSLVLATAFVMFRSRDLAGLKGLAAELATRGSGTGSGWVIPLVGALRGALEKDFGSVVALGERVRGSVVRPGYPPLISRYMVERQASALIQLGSPWEALEIVAGMRSPDGHAVCFPKVRAGAYFQMGRPRAAIDGTQECVDGADWHSPLTLAGVLVRRAAAFQAIGRADDADRAFTGALRRLESLGDFLPEIGVPVPALLPIALRVSRAEPGLFRHVLGGVVPETGMVGVLGENPPDGRLTDRERDAARLLITGLPVRRIAEELGVSLNTVKTQLRSLYRKLGVGSRQEAVARLDAEGFGAPYRPVAG